MEQKRTWMRYLLIGISALITLTTGCKSQTERRTDAVLMFVNETDYSIDYSGLFKLSPNTTHTEHIVGVGGKGINSENCCQGALESFQGSFNQVYLILNDSLCVFYAENEGPTILSNFETVIAEDNSYQFKYTFVGDSLTNVKICDR